MKKGNGYYILTVWNVIVSVPCTLTVNEPSSHLLVLCREMLQQFVEDEAELSGSEAESDENLDLDEEEDYLEMEAGDNDVTLNQDELRDQVGRVHM